MGEPSGYFRHPSIHGDTIVFVGEDDLWTVAAEGGVPRRLTASPAACAFPVFSPDGRRVAFTARDEGPAEAYVIDAAGGDPRRLTWLGAMTTTAGWSRDGAEVLVASDAGQPFRGYSHLHAVPAGGGPARPLALGPARALAFEPKGKGVALARNSGDPARWKRYRGGTAGTLWIDRQGSGEFAPFVPLDGNLAAPMWVGDRVYFLSDHEGHGNLYSARPDGGDLRRHTDHEDFYVRFPNTDGRRIAYHAGADLFVFDPATGRSKKVAIEHRSPRSQRTRRFVPAQKHLESLDLHPEGHSVALVVRGQVHTMGLFDGPATRTARPAARLRLAAWLPDGKRLVAVCDEGGEERLVVLTADGSAAPRTLPADVGRPLELAVAPKGADRVALANQRNEVVVVDLSSGDAKVVERSVFDRIDGVAWSPDGRRLAYGFPASRRTSGIRLHDLAAGTTADATRPEFRDARPSFDPDGKYLYFVSYRVFDPVYDAHYFDLGFPKGARPCLVTLRKDLPSPFSSTHRVPRGVAAPAATPAPAAPPGTAPAGPPPVASPAPPAEPKALSPVEGVAVDLDGIADRVVAFPVPEARVLQVLGAPGRALFLTWPVEGSLATDWRTGGEPEAKGTLEAWDFEADKAVTTATGVTSAAVSLDGKTLAIRAGNRLRAVAPSVLARDLPAKDDPGRETGWLDLDRARVEVVPADEWKQMFLEAWRLQRDQFWTADMSGVDWAAVRDRYLPLVPRCATRAEFSDLLWEMQGELGTSHAYEIGGDYRPEPAWHVGFLGADLMWDADARGWRVVRIPHGDSWEAGKSSPLTAPGVGAGVGDVIVAVDGELVSAEAPPAARLVHQAGRDVRLTLAGKDGARRTVAVRTLKEEQSLRYRDWVEANRDRVHAASGGKLGYVHVPNMGPSGYAEFHRYFAPEVDHEGLVVDVRWNGGGHVSQLLLEKLMRPRHGWNASRWMAPAPYPDDAPVGPMVALTNEYAGSDGDIFSHSFKSYGLGPLIGKRTWGGVVGIWPRHTLVDGTITTQPEFAFWFKDVGYGVEGRGVSPDIEVEIRPQDHFRGLDPQLERAIAECLALVKSRGVRAPDFAAARPPRAPKPLPKRKAT